LFDLVFTSLIEELFWQRIIFWFIIIENLYEYL
jgi:hypothetical protein